MHLTIKHLKNINLSFPVIVILMGIIFSLYLQSHISYGAFYSGDGGLKALLAQQIAYQLGESPITFDLVPPPEEWVQQLWKEGFYPYKQPFVYYINNKYYITFPYTFPLLTAPFYRVFGYFGLYIIPLIGTWGIWISFYWTCIQFKLKTIYITIGLLGIIFSSYLTIYSAMYWEHSLATFLAFTGLSILLVGIHRQSLLKNQAILSGVFMGLASWFRPEFLVLVLYISCFLIVSWLLKHKYVYKFIHKYSFISQITSSLQQELILVLSMVGTVGLFFLSNHLIYGHFLGIHAIQIVEESIGNRLQVGKDNLYIMTFGKHSFFLFFPLAIIPMFCDTIFFLISVIKKRKLEVNIVVVVIYLLAILFTITIAVQVPIGAGGKQWGPRFLQLLVPLSSLLLVMKLQNISTYKKSVKLILPFLWGLFFMLGSYQNNILGVEHLDNEYKLISPAAEYLSISKASVVIFSHQFVGQVLQYSINQQLDPAMERSRITFKVEDERQLQILKEKMMGKDSGNVLYVCYISKCPLYRKAVSDGEKAEIESKDSSQFGKYSIYHEKNLK